MFRHCPDCGRETPHARFEQGGSRYVGCVACKGSWGEADVSDPCAPELAAEVEAARVFTRAEFETMKADCANCDEDLPPGSSASLSGFCNQHCENRHRGDPCDVPCDYCDDDDERPAEETYPFTVATYCLCGCHDQAGVHHIEAATAEAAVRQVREDAEGRVLYVVAVFEGHHSLIGSEDDYPDAPDDGEGVDFDEECRRLRARGEHDDSHAPGCDGFCDHLSDHTNACMSEDSEERMMLAEEQERSRRPAACRRGQCMCATH